MTQVKQLRQMIEAVRFEIGQTSNPAQSPQQRQKIVYLLGRVQEELYAHHDWPILKVYRDKSLVVGAKLYDFPTDIAFENVMTVSADQGDNRFTPLRYGIGDAEYATYNDADRIDPPQAWQYYPDTKQFEIWPVPATVSTVRFWGTKALGPLVGEDDMSTLDANMLVLFVAAELLAAQKQETAELKLQKANELLRKLRGRTDKTEGYVMGAVNPDEGAKHPRHPQLVRVPMGGS